MHDKHVLHGMFLPKKFFVVSGKGESVTSLNAFDTALIDAGIDQCNLVLISSILPPDAVYISNPIPAITPGTITYTVLSRMDGEHEETIGAGLGWALGIRDNEMKMGIVAEDYGFKNHKDVERTTKTKLEEMARVRNLKVIEQSIKVESMKVHKNYGCVLVALIFVPWTIEEGSRPL